MFYGLARGLNDEGIAVSVIIRNLRSSTRHGAEKEARRIATNKGFGFEGIHPAKNHIRKQGEIKQNHTLPRERAAALKAWRG